MFDEFNIKKHKSKTGKRTLDIVEFKGKNYKRIYKNMKIIISANKDFINYNHKQVYDYDDDYKKVIQILRSDKQI